MIKKIKQLVDWILLSKRGRQEVKQLREIGNLLDYPWDGGDQNVPNWTDCIYRPYNKPDSLQFKRYYENQRSALDKNDLNMWMGKHLYEYTKEELIEIASELGRLYQEALRRGSKDDPFKKFIKSAEK